MGDIYYWLASRRHRLETCKVCFQHWNRYKHCCTWNIVYSSSLHLYFSRGDMKKIKSRESLSRSTDLFFFFFSFFFFFLFFFSTVSTRFFWDKSSVLAIIYAWICCNFSANCTEVEVNVECNLNVWVIKQRTCESVASLELIIMSKEPSEHGNKIPLHQISIDK